jgi:tRNA dimethylallyltransferase
LERKKITLVLGPTACGKTALALSLFSRGGFGGIINGDASQMYKQVSVGVASPSAYELAQAPHYLFSFLDCKVRNFTAPQYRTQVERLLADNQLWKKGPPLIVGGSLFYIKSLFFKIVDSVSSSGSKLNTRPEGISDWEYLSLVDPERAIKIHPHDSYRVERALELYLQSGVLPSLLEPQFNPVSVPATVVWVDLPDDELRARICLRVDKMLAGGWVAEVESLIGSEYEDFARLEGALGYQDVYQWICDGKKPETLAELKKILELKTWDYVRRQRKFWRSFKRLLQNYPELIEIIEK